MAEAWERDEFLAKALPLLMGECKRTGVDSNWCSVHLSHFRRGSVQATCNDVLDHDDFGDRLIEMWDGRG